MKSFHDNFQPVPFTKPVPFDKEVTGVFYDSRKVLENISEQLS